MPKEHYKLFLVSLIDSLIKYLHAREYEVISSYTLITIIIKIGILFSAETKGGQNTLTMSLKDLAEAGKISEHETDDRRLIIDL